MATSSAQAGYLTPSSSPAQDLALEDVLQPVLVGLTGLAPDLVRPRWQPNPPPTPAFNVNWCSFGITELQADTFAHLQHVPQASSGQGESVLSKDELITVLHSFYGPAAQRNCERLRDGVQIEQNRAQLLAAGLAVVEVQASRLAPALIEQSWVRKVDVAVVYRRRANTSYPIRTILSGAAGLDNEHYITPIVINHS